MRKRTRRYNLPPSKFFCVQASSILSPIFIHFVFRLSSFLICFFFSFLEFIGIKNEHLRIILEVFRIWIFLDRPVSEAGRDRGIQEERQRDSFHQNLSVSVVKQIEKLDSELRKNPLLNNQKSWTGILKNRTGKSRELRWIVSVRNLVRSSGNAQTNPLSHIFLPVRRWIHQK